MLRRVAAISLCGALVGAVAACGSSASGGGTQKSAPLSVTITASPNEESYAAWVAQAEGFFTKEGVNAKLVPYTGGADLLTVMEAGSTNFIVQDPLDGPTSALEKGGTIKYLLMPTAAATQQISIRKNAPAAQKIESAGSPTAQLQALKGSHYTVGVSTTASSSYTYLYSAAKLYGMTTGPGKDIDITTLGTPSNEIVAINVGKVDSVAGVPPTTTQPNTFSIQLDQVSPFNVVPGGYLTTTDKFIKANPKAVQGVVTAMVDACEFIQKHPAQAEKDVVKATQTADPTTKAATAQANFSVSLPTFKNPFPGKVAYESESKMSNGQPAAGPLPAYSTAIDPQFATAAFKKAGLQVPNG